MRAERRKRWLALPIRCLLPTAIISLTPASSNFATRESMALLVEVQASTREDCGQGTNRKRFRGGGREQRERNRARGQERGRGRTGGGALPTGESLDATVFRAQGGGGRDKATTHGPK